MLYNFGSSPVVAARLMFSSVKVVKMMTLHFFTKPKNIFAVALKYT